MLQLHPRPQSQIALELAMLGWFFSDVSNEVRRKGLGPHTDLLLKGATPREERDPWACHLPSAKDNSLRGAGL